MASFSRNILIEEIFLIDLKNLKHHKQQKSREEKDQGTVVVDKTRSRHRIQ